MKFVSPLPCTRPVGRSSSLVLTALAGVLVLGRPDLAFAQEEGLPGTAEPPTPGPEDTPSSSTGAPEAAADPSAAPEPGATPAAEPVVPAPSEPAPVAEAVPEAPAPEAAAPAGPLEVTASAFSRFEYRQNYDTLGVSRARFVEGDTTVYRARLGLRTRPLEVTDGVVALLQFSPQVSGQYGKTGTIAEQNVGVYEGYVRIAGEALSVDFGRFAMNYGDSLVIGNLDWHQTGRAFEGARSRYTFEKGWIDVFVTQTPRAGDLSAEGHPVVNSPLFAGDTYFWGVYSSLGKLVRESMDLDVYLLGLSKAKTRGVAVDAEDPTAGTYTQRAASELTFGLRAKDKLGEALDYRLEAGVQGGARPNAVDGGRSTRSVSAYQVEGELGVRPAEPLRIALGGASASGDDPTTTDRDEGWNELYPTGHKFLGLMDVVGARNNIWSAMAKVQAKLSGALTLNVDGHYFGRFEVPPGVDKQVGTEVDTYLVHKIGGPLAARVLYGVFLPNSEHFANSETAHYGEAEIAFVF